MPTLYIYEVKANTMYLPIQIPLTTRLKTLHANTVLLTLVTNSTYNHTSPVINTETIKAGQFLRQRHKAKHILNTEIFIF